MEVIEMGFQTDKAFDQGCDARLAGLPDSAHPYTEEQGTLTMYFKWGWDHVDKFWNCDNRKYAALVLPSVRGKV